LAKVPVELEIVVRGLERETRDSSSRYQAITNLAATHWPFKPLKQQQQQ
jgi:hypothetical protein